MLHYKKKMTMSYGRLSLDEIRSKRLQMLSVSVSSSAQKQKSPHSSNSILPIFLGYNSGPLFSRLGEEDVVAKSEQQVILRCKEEMEKITNGKKSFSVIGLQDLIDSLSYDKNHFGLAVHLLHIYPFSLIDRITLDCCKVPMPHPTPSKIVGAVVKSITSKDTLWIGVPKLPKYKDILMSHHNRETYGNLQQNNDPLLDYTSMWGQFLHIPLLDRPYSDSATGLYVTTASHYAMKVSAMKDMFKAYKPYTLPSHDDCPLETNAVIRWKKAADVFDYSYTIENITKQTFIRVPKDLIQTINSILSKNNGRCSLMKLIQYLKNVYATGSENIVVLLRHISPKGEWIFAHNLSPPSSSSSSSSAQVTLAEGCLDYDVKGNKCKYFWETMEEMESGLKMSFTEIKSNSVQKVAYESLIGFRYECGLRKRADMSGICPYRFSSRAEKIRHIKSHHAMDETQEKRMDEFFTHLQPLDSIESDQEFLERKGIAEVYDIKKLCLLPDIGAIMDEFVKVRVRNNKMVTQMNHLWEEFASSHSILLGEMERKKMEWRSTVEEEKKKKLEINIEAEKNRLNFCCDIVKMYRKIVLPNDVFNRYMCCLLAAIKQHVSVMTKYNEIQEGLQEADMVASDMSRVITSDWHAQLNKAGMNVASMTSDAYLQHSRRETTPSNYSSVALGMIISLEEHKKTSVQHTANVYKDLLEKGGCNPKELEIETNAHGMGGIGASNSKRKHKDDDDDDESRGGEEELKICSPYLIHLAVKKHKKETGNFPSGEILKMNKKKKDVFPLSQIYQKKQGVFQSYDIVLPGDIQVDLRDNRELMLYILSVMQDVKLEELVSRLRCALVNVVNVMFLLNDEGVWMLDATLQQMILNVTRKKDSSLFEKKRLLWRIFVSAVYFINSNPDGILNSLFRVRLYLPNDLGRKRQKLLPECATFKYDSFETNQHATVEFFSRGIKAFLQKIMEPTFLPKMGETVVKDQVKLRSILSRDIGIVPPPPHHRPYREGYQKYMAIQQSNLDLPSIKPMKREELELHMRERYKLKENKCPICLEKMSNRPLELFNCHYKTLEKIFKLKNGIPESQNIELSPTLYERYTQFVSKEIERVGKGKADSAAGGHLFHRDCIRRAIQYAALDPSKYTITCPICKTDIYNSTEKQIILMNITRMACELAVGIENTDICGMDTDDLINLKKCDRKNTIYSNFSTISVDSGKGEEKCVSNDMTTRCGYEAVLEITEKEGKEKCLKWIADYIRVVVDKRDEINVDDMYHQFHKPGYESVDKDAMYLLSAAHV